jgi:hypothetical protein
MKTIKIIFCLIIVIIYFIGCRKDSTINHNTIEEIEYYINSHRLDLVYNSSKTLQYYGLLEDELNFQNKRLDYFIALLNNDEIKINEYYIVENDFYWKIPPESREFYFYTKENLDFRLFKILENNINEIKLPLIIINKYFNSRYFIKKN